MHRPHRWPPTDDVWQRLRLGEASAWRGRSSPSAPLSAASAGAGGRDETLARVEAVLFALDQPLSPQRLTKLAGLTTPGDARRLVQRLNELYAADDSAFRVAEIAGGYQLLTDPALRPHLDRVAADQVELRLSPPALETLTIVAYRQPIGRADVEAIRGVQCGEILTALIDRSLIRVAGREESLGRPYLYGTTKRFLQLFGLRSLHELPAAERLQASAD